MRKSQIVQLILIFLAALFIRVWFISNGSFLFTFDQARDLTASEEILRGDLKLFGPSASGTKDTIYHGVFYYYILALFNALAHNVQLVNVLLVILVSFSVFPVYFFTKEVLRSHWAALFVAALTALSSENIIMSSWMSNPVLSLLSLPFFFYFFTSLRRDFSYKNMIGCCASLGLSIQSVIFEVYWMMPLLWLFFTFIFSERLKSSPNKWRIWITGFGVLFAVVSSMTLTEFLMIKRGILNFEVLKSFNTGESVGPFDQLFLSCKSIITKLSASIGPRLGLFSIILLFVQFFQKDVSLTLKKIFPLLITPLLFLSLYYRDSQHLLLGLEVLVYVLIAGSMMYWAQFVQAKLRWVFPLLFFVVFTALNLSVLFSIRESHNHPLAIQKSFFYSDQVELVKKVFELSNGRPFSIATLTNPYNVTVTWAYLFDKQSKIVGVPAPLFYGPDQTGYPGSYLLGRTQKAEDIHFAIFEPETGINASLIDSFWKEQSSIGREEYRSKFGGLEMVMYKRSDARK